MSSRKSPQSETVSQLLPHPETEPTASRTREPGATLPATRERRSYLSGVPHTYPPCMDIPVRASRSVSGPRNIRGTVHGGLVYRRLFGRGGPHQGRLHLHM